MPVPPRWPTTCGVSAAATRSRRGRSAFSNAAGNGRGGGRSSAALVAGIVLVTLLGFAGVTWQWRVAVWERNEQEYQRQQARTALYYSRIAQSQLQWRVNDLPGALRSLEDCVQPGDHQDRRGWEWYYLQTLYRPELFTFNHAGPGPEGSVAFDPTGRTIASVVSFAPDNESERVRISPVGCL